MVVAAFQVDIIAYSEAMLLLFAAIMARFSCSYVTNITTFQEPSRKNDGMNLKTEYNKKKVHSVCFTAIEGLI